MASCTLKYCDVCSQLKGRLKDLQIETLKYQVEAYESVLKDLAWSGTRHSLSPNFYLDRIEDKRAAMQNLYNTFEDYIGGMDKYVKLFAGNALKRFNVPITRIPEGEQSYNFGIKNFSPEEVTGNSEGVFTSKGKE